MHFIYRFTVGIHTHLHQFQRLKATHSPSAGFCLQHQSSPSFPVAHPGTQTLHPLFFQALLTLPSPGMYPVSLVGAGEVLNGSGSSPRDEVRAGMERSFWRHRGRTQRGARHTWWEPGLRDGGDKRWPLCTEGVSSVCGGGDHVCDCEGGSSISLCEPKEGPLFLPSHCTLVPRNGE